MESIGVYWIPIFQILERRGFEVYLVNTQMSKVSSVERQRSSNGLDAMTVQTILSKIGTDMSKWKTVKQFTSWLGLCPRNAKTIIYRILLSETELLSVP